MEGEEEIPLLRGKTYSSQAAESSSSLYSSDGEYVNIHGITTNSPTSSMLSIGFNSYLNIKSENPDFCIDVSNCRGQNQHLSTQQAVISPPMLVDSKQVVLTPSFDETLQVGLFGKEIEEKSYGPKFSKFLANVSLPICQMITRLIPKFIICNATGQVEKEPPGTFTDQEPNLSGSLSIQYPVTMVDVAFCLEANSVFLKRDHLQRDYYHLSFKYSNATPVSISILLDADLSMDDTSKTIK